MDPAAYIFASALEGAFRRLLHPNPTSRDGFMLSPTKEIQIGLEHLNTAGVLLADDYSAWRQEYDFGDRPLREVLGDMANVKQINQLIRKMKRLSIK